MTLDEFRDKWAEQWQQWCDIASEMRAAAPDGEPVTAHQITVEQRKRLLAEGKRLFTFADVEHDPKQAFR